MTVRVSQEVRKHAGRQKLSDDVRRILQQDTTLPVFSSTALKLIDAANRVDLDMGTIAEIVKLDPGLTTKYLKLANSVWFRGRSIMSVEDALIRIGLREVRRLASTIGVMDVLSLFRTGTRGRPINPRIEVEWEMFWLHSILTARLTECLAASYRAVVGKEYLAGLLHDVGKLFMGRYFHPQFESAMAHALEKGCSLFEAEEELFDTTHAEIGWALCEKWRLHPEVTRSIRLHHKPTSDSPLNQDAADREFQHFLAVCLHVANALANMCNANIQGARSPEEIDPESLPEWRLFRKYTPRGELELDVVAELQKAQEAIQILIV